MTVKEALNQLISMRNDTKLNVRDFPDAEIFKNDLKALNIAIHVLKDILDVLKEDEKK